MILSRFRGYNSCCTIDSVVASCCAVATFCVLTVGVICTAGKTIAQDDDLLNGVLSTVRIDGVESPEFVAGSIRYDSPTRAEQIRWRGMLQVQGSQSVAFHSAGPAQFSIKIDGQPVQLGRTIELDAGLRDLDVTATVQLGESDDADEVLEPIGLFWSSDRFGLEPVPSHLLWHFYDDVPEVSIADGQALARGLRCAACHDYGETSPVLPAPSLTSLRDNIRPSWLVEHLSRQTAESSSRMPAFGLHRNDAAAISACLFEESQKPADVPEYDAWIEKQNKSRKKDNRLSMEPDIKAGERLFMSVGCLACHHVDQVAAPESSTARMYTGGDLSSVAGKRTPSAIKRLLADPSSINAAHRMPRPDLNPKEQQDLAAYLTRLGADGSQGDVRAWGDTDRGYGLLMKNRCAACHELPEAIAPATAPAPRKIALSDASDWTGGCLDGPSPQKNRPGYSLSEEEAAAVRAYILAREQLPEKTRGEQVMLEQNCLSCHDRDSRQGISQHVAGILKHFDSGAVDGAALVPPRLHSVGDKLHRDALKKAISSDAPRLRPWLDVRMPRYSLSGDEQNAIVDHLNREDRIPAQLRSGSSGQASTGDPVHQLAAGRLVTADGFGCQSCHQIGDTAAPKVDLKARGPNLAMLGERIRPTWFERWVQGPARIVPRMEMPAITKAAPGVLDNSLEKQIDALWSALNDPDFEPPEPNPESVARTRNDPETEEQPIILTDVFECENDQTYLRPVVVGLSNRQNIMFDLERAEVTAWWSGDTAFQRTRGKTWYWEPGAPFHGANNPELSERVAPLEAYRLIDAEGQVWSPKRDGQWSAHLESLRSGAGKVTIASTLTLANSLGDSLKIGLKQEVASNAFNGFDVETTFSGVPAGYQIAVVGYGSAKALVEADGQEIQVPISSLATQNWRGVIGDDGWIYPETRLVDRSRSFTASYRGQVADQFLAQVPPATKLTAEDLDVVPGFEAQQLPLSIEEMPISLAWDPSGTLYVGSLKGGVFTCLDTDGDGLEDVYHAIAPNLPTPYGLAAFEDHVDVLSKYALLRINHPEGPNVDLQVLNDDWGYTHDYHDWAVGLEQDSDGNYYIALPCQQDDRSAAAAFRRGTAIKLTPSSSGGRPRYVAEEIAAGLRFPMGIALRDDGELFTSDNQGNYNPFNEINHVRQGKRYGFINKLEKQPGFAPPLEPPAINLPHPWTRSVNGICFLTTPPGMPRGHFGAFEGHLIGCEMNGRSLIRMSLHRVGDTLQGAAYPFSVPNVPADQPNFEGPIVCEIAPSGDIYVGNLHDSGWGGGQNTGSIVRLSPSGKLPLGFAEVIATRAGLRVQFTGTVPQSALEPKNYALRSYRRISTPIYGGDDVESRSEPIASVSQVSNKAVQLVLEKPLRSDCVYEIQSTISDGSGKKIFPAEAHYTMRKIPE